MLNATDPITSSEVTWTKTKTILAKLLMEEADKVDDEVEIDPNEITDRDAYTFIRRESELRRELRDEDIDEEEFEAERNDLAIDLIERIVIRC